ncbi:hypothetical protein [Roseospirillum parvum]|uniref:Proteolipid membrane potential modulator n=1 Tax=Roseospirillum parvum TaxID=83401 RepID=A0A1G7Z5L3_9PROT|nr:hypothetical protein [Roseospirillum parvum]SDH03917.1 hypothetical protein SAMN05421742_1048 [Roseospirillum parvum]
MIYLVALFVPPLGLLFAGKFIQAILNLSLLVIAFLILVGTLGFASPISFGLWLAAVIHAVLVVHNSRAEARNRELIDAMRQNRG